MTIEIGKKPLKEMSQEDLRQIVIIEGCCPSLQYWNEPEVIDFNDNMFSNTHYIDYISYRKSDLLKSSEYTFFFDFENFSFHYTKDYSQQPNQETNGKRVGLETLRFLIRQGYNVPLNP